MRIFNTQDNTFTRPVIINNDLTVTGSMTALSAYINVIDITYYELSGFNVTGDVNVEGIVTATAQISTNNLFTNNGNISSLLVETLTGSRIIVTNVTHPTAVSDERYKILSLSEAEPNLGVPQFTGVFFLTGNNIGNRGWTTGLPELNLDKIRAVEIFTIHLSALSAHIDKLFVEYLFTENAYISSLSNLSLSSNYILVNNLSAANIETYNLTTTNAVVSTLIFDSLSGSTGNIDNFYSKIINSDSLLVNNLTAVSATINVVDITLYELSGFNVTGNVSIDGNLSVTSNLFTNNGNISSLRVDSLTGKFGIINNIDSNYIFSDEAYFTTLTANTAFIDDLRVKSNLINTNKIEALTATFDVLTIKKVLSSYGTTNIFDTNSFNPSLILRQNNLSGSALQVLGNTTFSGNISGNNLKASFNLGNAVGNYSFAENTGIALSGFSHAEGYNTVASNSAAHAEGYQTYASGIASHAEGAFTYALGYGSHAEGNLNVSSNLRSHSEGLRTVAATPNSHAEGVGTMVGSTVPITNYNATNKLITFTPTLSSTVFRQLSGSFENKFILRGNFYEPNDDVFYDVLIDFKSIEGVNGSITANSVKNLTNLPNNLTIPELTMDCTAGYVVLNLNAGGGAHAEGNNTQVAGNAGHAEGYYNVVYGTAGHAEGSYTIAAGSNSHSAGTYSTALQDYTYAWSDGRLGTATQNISTTRTGQYMVSASGGVFIPGRVGIGVDSLKTGLSSNALTVVGVVSTAGYIMLNSVPFRSFSRDNIMVGISAGDRLYAGGQPGIGNLLLGEQTGVLTTSGNHNIFLGRQSGKDNTVGSSNTFIGYQAGWKNIIGNDNIFLGRSAGRYNSVGSSNNFFGVKSGYNNLSGNHNNFFGTCAGFFNVSGSSNNFFGVYAGCNNTSGCHNIIFGCTAGAANNTGNHNNFFGARAGRNNISGSSNNFFGYYAGFTNSTGANNNFFGNRSGRSNTTGTHNNFIGFRSGYSNTTGSLNNMFGYSAGRFNTIGSCNNFFGFNAGRNNTTGFNNIAIGSLAGCNVRDGINNIFIGANANTDSTILSSISGAIVLGTNATALADNELVIGSSSWPLSTIYDTTFTGQVSSLVVRLNSSLFKIPIIPA